MRFGLAKIKTVPGFNKKTDDNFKEILYNVSFFYLL